MIFTLTTMLLINGNCGVHEILQHLEFNSIISTLPVVTENRTWHWT